jgi:hypothetical protein
MSDSDKVKTMMMEEGVLFEFHAFESAKMNRKITSAELLQLSAHDEDGGQF